ncbi:CoA-binding protein [Anaerosporomusa subterranea]|uniref:CoA-binding protein n=1 Tax=Anaerosporomusa subterranea TaxID=1794912 RepID=UPI000824DE3B|nr:CoA-binding protein [Anaerosporomusa subterranea]
MNPQVKDMLQRQRWAVLGASANPDKFGYRIFKVLKRYGYEVYPVNSRESMIDGEPCFPSIAALPVVPNVVDFVVPPAVALEGLAECASLGIANVWLQPGVNKPEVVAKAKDLGLNVIYQYCAMVESSKIAMLKEKNWAVLGESARSSEDSMLFDRLRNRGYNVASLSVISVSGETRVDAPLFADLPQKPAVALIAGPASITEQALRECKAAGIEYVWLQPGAETEELITLGLSLNLIIVHHASVLEELE